MSREFKFRVWCKFENDFLPDFSFTINTAGELMVDNKVHSNQNEFVLHQYTGLKDKNGNEIYEGDIVKIPIINGQYEGLTELREVKWDSRELRWGLVRKRYESMCQGISYYKTDIEVVGNIYENPELLK